MNLENDKQLRFVLRYYQAGKLDTQKAIRKAPSPQPLYGAAPHSRALLAYPLPFGQGGNTPAKVVPLWRKVAIAASFTLLIIGGAFATYLTMSNGPAESTIENTTISPQTSPKAEARHFHFDNTPLPEVLQTLGQHYGVTLTASETDKRLTADFDSDNLDETLSMIEQVLGVKIVIGESSLSPSGSR